MRIDLYTVRLFVATYEEKSISRAAARENIAPSALSRRLSDLETYIGKRLFYRKNTGMALTPAGSVMLYHARILMRDVTQLERTLADVSVGKIGNVKLCANAWAMAQYLPTDLASFAKQYPNIDIALEQSISPLSVQSVTENAVDMAILGDEHVTAGLVKFKYKEEKWRVMIPMDHPLSGQSAVGLADILEYDFVGVTRGSAIDTLVRREAERLKRSIKLRVRVSGFEVVGAMVEAGLGISIVSERMLDRYQKSMKVSSVDLTEDWATRRLMVCLKDKASLTPAARILLDHLLSPSS